MDLNQMIEQCKRTGQIAVGKGEVRGSDEERVIMLIPVVGEGPNGVSEHVISVALQQQEAVFIAERLLLAANQNETGWVKDGDEVV